MMARPFILGLTGSIGMGKSTTASMFRDHGIPVWDADEAVRRLYAPGEAGARAIAALAPRAVTDGAVDRAILRDEIGADPGLLTRIEAAVHPLVREDRGRFVARSGAEIVVCDVPLLFETGSQDEFDAVAVVSAPPDVQRARVLSRSTMTEAQFRAILDRQMPDADKRARADYVIDTTTMDGARAQVADVVAEIRRRLSDA